MSDATGGQIHFDESGQLRHQLRDQLDAAEVSLDKVRNLALSLKRDLESQKRINHYLKNHLDVLHSFQQELLDGLAQRKDSQGWIRMAAQLRRAGAVVMQEGRRRLEQMERGQEQKPTMTVPQLRKAFGKAFGRKADQKK